MDWCSWRSRFRFLLRPPLFSIRHAYLSWRRQSCGANHSAAMFSEVNLRLLRPPEDRAPIGPVPCQACAFHDMQNFQRIERRAIKKVECTKIQYLLPQPLVGHAGIQDKFRGHRHLVELPQEGLPTLIERTVFVDDNRYFAGVASKLDFPSRLTQYRSKGGGILLARANYQD